MRSIPPKFKAIFFFLIVKVNVRLNGSGAVSVNVYFVYSIIYNAHNTQYHLYLQQLYSTVMEKNLQGDGIK